MFKSIVYSSEEEFFNHVLFYRQNIAKLFITIDEPEKVIYFYAIFDTNYLIGAKTKLLINNYDYYVNRYTTLFPELEIVNQSNYEPLILQRKAKF